MCFSYLNPNSGIKKKFAIIDNLYTLEYNTYKYTNVNGGILC